MPHLDAAFRLARWLVRNDADAEDVVQESYLRAYRFYDHLRGETVRPWLLTIVRNTCYTWLKRQRRYDVYEADGVDVSDVEDEDLTPEARMVRDDDAARLHFAIERLKPEFREVLTLREFEGLSYKEIAEVTGASLGTVMSRLSRARQRLYETLVENDRTEVHRRGLR